ncbi:hypothetical protein NAF17_13260 [Mucilaginibacter sp. RB4R14]|uniref:DUF6671 family protein n=1 Tax=Mucilaginibacter aurantiaciroseus TaxID=2949308 RepID=UPI0020912927|nr:DUF6671 family protein [Mucilaginibacter aurantiaciroseus]MCO5936509.1 hypothetical protein [Mucilaginibacter aurantiaciroseus]
MIDFAGRTLIIATKHAKQQVMAPLLEEALGVHCLVITELDTDQLGTFSGEVEREDDPLTTARKKCQLAMRLSDCELAVASEGSFGMHPATFFCYADEELVILVDQKNNLEIATVMISTQTNFNGAEINDKLALLDFAERANFPSHGLILRKAKNDHEMVIKGIHTPEKLLYVFDALWEKYGSAYVETDMRAMHNPKRMAVIKQATRKLVDKVLSRCPNCTAPGFGVIAAKPGLPCRLCGLPTQSSLAYIYRCQQCEFEKEEQYPNQIQTEDPQYCDFCNP